MAAPTRRQVSAAAAAAVHSAFPATVLGVSGRMVKYEGSLLPMKATLL